MGFDSEEAGDMEHGPITHCPGDPMVLGVQIEHKPNSAG